MELQYFLDNLANPAVLVPEIIKEHNTCFKLENYKEYYPEFHKVMDRAKRPDKVIDVPTDELDDNGNAITRKKTESVARIPIPFQRLIVTRSTAFLTGGGVKLNASPENPEEESLLKEVKSTWNKNKTDFINGEIAEAFMSETEACEIWYSKVDEAKNVELKCNVYKPSEGYKLIPVFDATRDLIAFGLGYESETIEEGKIEHVDIYTKDSLIRHKKDKSGVWMADTPIKLLYGKIPVIYYSTNETAWHIVEAAIERYETLISNFADTNDYNGSPILFASGNIKGFSSKGERGKVIEGEGEGADLKYITWQGAPEAIKLEIAELKEIIYTCTQTPNISFEAMKSLGDISGVAFDRIMMDAHLKAIKQQSGMYGKGIQRRLNFMVSALAEIKNLSKAKGLNIQPVFNLFTIGAEKERIELALQANGSQPVMSQEESIAYVGMSQNVSDTIEKINAQTQPTTAQ